MHLEILLFAHLGDSSFLLLSLKFQASFRVRVYRCILIGQLCSLTLLTPVEPMSEAPAAEHNAPVWLDADPCCSASASKIR
jgi:hypothetical protein